MIVKVMEDEFFPSDMIVLKSADEKGGLFVETKNLDGETNLKTKSVHRLMLDKLEDNNLQSYNAKVVCEPPNNAIYKYEGYIEINDQKIPLSADNLLLRGCKLRNT